MSLLADVLGDRGGPATIIFSPGEVDARNRQEFEYVALTNGGVMHTDGDGNVRWHPPSSIYMVIWGGNRA